MKKMILFFAALFMGLTMSAKTIYLNTGGGSLWNQANATFFVHAWGVEDEDLQMTLVSGDVYSVEIKDGNTGIIFLREYSGATTVIWDKKDDGLWNKTGDLTIPADKDCYTITGWNEDDGAWSVYAPSTPDPEGFYITGDTALVVAAGLDKNEAWHADAIKVVGSTYEFASLPKGDYKLKVTLKGEFKDGEIKGFDELTESVAGLSTDGDKNICFTLAEAAKVTVTYTGSVFKVEGNFYVAPIDPSKKAIRLVPGVWNKDGAKFAAVTWKTGEVMESAAAVLTDWFVGTDTVTGLIPADADSIAFARFSGELAAPTLDLSKIWNHSDKLLIDASLLYTISDWGEEGKFSPGYWGTLTPDPEGFYITGDTALVVAAGLDKNEAWHADAIKVVGSTYEFASLPKGDYKLKVTLKGEFKDGEIKGFDELTESVAGLSTDGDKNICFTLAEAAKVTVTYTGSVFKVEGNFYVAPIDPSKKAIRLVPGVWNKDGAKFAAVTWKTGEVMESAAAVLTDWFVGTDTVTGLIPADADSIAFARFSGELAAPTLDLSKIWNHSDKLLIDASLLYTISDWGEEGKFSPGYWGTTPPVENVEWYLVGDMTDWETNKTLFESSSITKNLTVIKTYGFKILKLKGSTKTWYGNDGTMTREYHEDWEFSASVEDNCKFDADVAGDYVFTMTLNGEGNPLVSLTFPAAGPDPGVTGFYITGNKELVGEENAWHADAIKVEGTEYTFVNLAAGDYKLKVTQNGEFKDGEIRGYDELTEKPDGLTPDDDRNICFTLSKPGDVKVTYTGSVFKVEGNFYVAPVADPEWYLVGDMTDWQNAKKSLASGSVVVNLTAQDYEFKILKVQGEDQSWFGNSGTMTRDNCAGWVFAEDDNCVITADVNGDYTFAMQVNGEGKPVVSVTYPNKSPEGFENIHSGKDTIKTVRDGQIVIIRGDKIFDVTGRQLQ